MTDWNALRDASRARREAEAALSPFEKVTAYSEKLAEAVRTAYEEMDGRARPMSSPLGRLLHDGISHLTVIKSNARFMQRDHEKEVARLTEEGEEWKRKFGDCHPIHLDGVIRATKAEAERDKLAAVVKDIFAALDGEGISFEYGQRPNGRPVSIGGLSSFTADWDTPVEPSWRGEPWDSLTTEQKFESSKFSAQHALIKRLADIKREAS